MSLQARCPWRIASRCATRALWQRRSVRRYASNTTNESEWFERLRAEMLSREPVHYSERLDYLHNDQFRNTIQDYLPHTYTDDGKKRVPVSNVLARFNIRKPESKLLIDGTDTQYSPGEPWSRRLWAGGAVRLNPYRKFMYSTPFRQMQTIICVERIKDVRLQGAGVDARILVTIERSYSAPVSSQKPSDSQVQEDTQIHSNLEKDPESPPEKDNGDDWDNVLMKEERELVFFKAKTAAELDSVVIPRYLEGTNVLFYSRLFVC